MARPSQVTFSSNERAALARLAEMLRDSRATLALITSTGERVVVPELLRPYLRQLVEAALRGSSLVLVSTDKLLTTTQAARLLGVSRPYLVRLLDEGKIGYEMVGSHRRVPVSEVLKYREQRRQKREMDLRELQRLSQELEQEVASDTVPMAP